MDEGHEVSIFLMYDGVYNVNKRNLRNWWIKAWHAICALNAEQRKVAKVDGILFGSQYDHACIASDVDSSYLLVNYEENNCDREKSSFNTCRNAEALRMSVGLTLREDKVTVIFMDDGVYTAPAQNPNLFISRHLTGIRALAMLKCRLLAEKSSMENRESLT